MTPTTCSLTTQVVLALVPDVPEKGNSGGMDVKYISSRLHHMPLSLDAVSMQVTPEANFPSKNEIFVLSICQKKLFDVYHQ